VLEEAAEPGSHKNPHNLLTRRLGEDVDSPPPKVGLVQDEGTNDEIQDCVSYTKGGPVIAEELDAGLLNLML